MGNVAGTVCTDVAFGVFCIWFKTVELLA